MGLAGWLTRKKHVSLWVVKQIDDGLLHVCGKGSVMADSKLSETLRQLREGNFQGPVRMGGNDAVLNSAQFAALIPEEEFRLANDNEALWQNRPWQLAWVPQRCWLHEGRLTSQSVDFQGQTRRISVEDTSQIRAKAEAPRTRSEFVSIEPLGHTAPGWQLVDRDDDSSHS